MSNYDDYNDFHADIYGSEGDLESGFDDLFGDLDADDEAIYDNTDDMDDTLIYDSKGDLPPEA